MMHNFEVTKVASPSEFNLNIFTRGLLIIQKQVSILARLTKIKAVVQMYVLFRIVTAYIFKLMQ